MSTQADSAAGTVAFTQAKKGTPHYFYILTSLLFFVLMMVGSRFAGTA